MPRSAGIAVENNFLRGLVSDATGLNFPEHSCQATSNCVFSQFGNVTRRKGFDLERDYQTTAISPSNTVINPFVWRNVGAAETTFVVLQVGILLYFYRTEASSSLSTNQIVDTVDISDFAAPGVTDPSVAIVEAQFATGDGKLFVTHANCNPFYVSFDEGTDTFTATELNLKIRDFDGVEDGLETSDRPAVLSDEHTYNLLNQGWSSGESGIDLTKITVFNGAVSDYPSNADIWWLYKNADGEYEPTAARVVSNTRGNSPAPKGYFILDALNQDRAAVSGISGLPTVTSNTSKPSTCAFFAGRIFYAGTAHEAFVSKIYFSQIAEKETQYEKCYQQNDPTSEHAFDLLPSDGGVIVIPEAGAILKLVAVSGSLVVFASNGIWAISGNTGVGFTANDYSVKPLSSIGVLSSKSFVDIGGFPSWWTADGIYILGEDKVAGLGIKSLTDKRENFGGISEFFAGIPFEAKKYARGAFNPVEKTVTWVYRNSIPHFVHERYRHTNVLTLNLLTGAYSSWTISPGVFVSSIVNVETHSTETEEVGHTNKYVVYYVSGTSNLTFAEVSDVGYADWASRTPVSYESSFVTAYMIRGDAIKKFQTNYINLFCDVQDDNFFYFSGRRSFAVTADSMKFSPQQEVSLIRQTAFSHQNKKLKLPGNGLVAQFAVTSVPFEPFNIVGWSAYETGNASV